MEPTFPHPESSNNASDEALSHLLSEYGQNLPAMPHGDDLWQQLQAELATDAAQLSATAQSTLLEQAALWADTPYALDNAARTAFEQHLSHKVDLQAHVAGITTLRQHLYHYGQRTGDTLANTIPITPRQLVEQAVGSIATSEPATVTPIVIPDIERGFPLPRWASAIAASLLLLATLGITPTDSPTAVATANAAPQSETMLVATAAPPVELYVMESCSDALPTSDWGVMTKCRF